MITRVVEWSTRRPWLVIVASLALAIAGWVGRRTLSRDVLPDLAEPQLVLVLDWMGHSAAEVANSATKMVTADLERIPGVVAVRGTSMADMAFVDLVFDARADLSAARRAIDERVPALRPKLPPNLRIQVGPIASSAGWVFQYALTDPTHGQNAASLRRLQDEVLRPALAAVPGVAEVASIGMAPPRLLVEAKPAELRERGIAFTDVVAACSTPAGEMGRAGVADLAARPIPVAGSPPSLVRDVALVRMADDMPSGVADLGGLHRPLGGIVVAARGANLAAVAENVKRTLDEVRPRLPRGTELTTVYDRGELILGVENSLVRALAEEIAAVVLVILVFLLDWRSALVPLTTLPLVLLLTCGAMRLLGVPATTMSLGGMGIALGMAVDADLVALEACHRRLEEGAASGGDRRRAIVAAAASFAPAI
ncbi:MAG TPA: efflux RND transporter permease subunit, partial [Polyangiaceae bacterium]|nr:efflux RND transporter permease subunit [Polyangiaceae bacterium]